VINTAKAMRRWARRRAIGEGTWRVHGVGVGGFARRRAVLDFGNSGTGCRLVMGAVAGCPVTATFDGDASLRKRPMRRILDPVESDRGARPSMARMAAVCRSRSRAHAIRSRSSTARRCLRPRSNRPCCSPGLAAPGQPSSSKPKRAAIITERLLKHFGADIAVEADGRRAARSR
jgi:3-phosphoshikimate 1-carboxyvinyltransferase